MKLVLYVAGLKGRQFLESLAGRAPIKTVVSYRQKNVIDDSFETIRQLCEKHNIECIAAHKPDAAALEPFDLCFVVGWQYLLANPDQRMVIFHDSLLPKYRGYSPTVAAVLAGDTRLGVTAILPCAEADRGAILDQDAVDITYPISMRDVFDRLSHCYSRIALRLLAVAEKQPLASIARPQVESEATYSLWRGPEDQWIDWSKDSQYIQRFVDALGWPFSGARSRYEGHEIIIHAVSVEPDMSIVERHPGKFWQISGGCPVVVCGAGMLRVENATGPDETPVAFTRVRSRFS